MRICVFEGVMNLFQFPHAFLDVGMMAMSGERSFGYLNLDGSSPVEIHHLSRDLSLSTKRKIIFIA